jgi:hypothetical protein
MLALPDTQGMEFVWKALRNIIYNVLALRLFPLVKNARHPLSLFPKTLQPGSLLGFSVVAIMASITISQDSAERLHICKEIFGSRVGRFTLRLEGRQGHQQPEASYGSL